MPRILIRQIRSKTRRDAIDFIRDEFGRVADRKVKQELLKRFEEVVADWDTKIRFKARKVITKDQIAIDVFPSGENKQIWIWVSVTGTKAHPIPKEGTDTTLRFQWGGKGSYKPRTKPVGQFGGPGKSSGPIRYFKKVNHPGFKPRLFEKVIADDYRKEFKKLAENAIRRAITKYNRSIRTEVK